MTYYPSWIDRGPRLSQHVQEILHHRVGSGDDLGVRRIGLLRDDQLGELVGDVGVGSLERRSDNGAALAVQRLSGSVGRLEGAAQKLIAAREITLGTPFLIACEPTRGIDIGAMDFIHDRLVEKRNQGDGILLVSSELSEIMTLSDRIYVIYEGRINGEFVRGDIDEKSLGLLMVGGHV